MVEILFARLTDVAAAGSFLALTDTPGSYAGEALKVVRVNAAETGLEFAAAGAGTPGGADTQVQFNDGGAFGGDADFLWDKTSNVLTILGTIELGHASDTTLSRVSPGVIAVEGNTIWHSGNDGAGSGLDADLLDGNSSAFYATATSVSDHLADAVDAHDASAISFAPQGSIAATDVQAAIQEVRDEAQPLDATLTALAAYNTNGLITQTAADTFTGRTIVGTASEVEVTQGDGVAGNPTIGLPNDVIITTSLTLANTGLHLLDTNATHDLIIAPGSNLTADRTLTITTGDASVTLNLTAVTDEFVLAYDTGTNTWRGVTPPAAGTPTLITVANEATDTTCFPAFFTAATGDLGPKTNANLTYNSNTGAFSIGTAQALTAGTIELGAASDTTIARVSAGIISVEGATVPLLNTTNTWTALNTFTLGTGAANEPVRIVNTTDNASVQTLQLEGDRATMAANDEAYVSMLLSDSAGNQDEFARMTWRGVDVTSTSNDARMTWSVAIADSLTAKLQLEGSVLAPSASDGTALGSGTLMWADLFLASGGVINFNNGNYTITHSAGLLTTNGNLSITTSGVFTAGTIELGAASDTTLARVSAGVVSIEGVTILTTATGQPLDADLTSWAGVTRAAGFDTFATTPTSANLAALVTNETGSGLLVFGTSPQLTTPEINDTSADHQYVFAVSELSADRTVTLPLLTGNDTFVFEAFIQTLTNKTFDLTSNTLVGSVAEFNAALEAADFYTTGGADVALADGGTGTSLADPGADRIMAWDDSAGVVKFSALADINTEGAPAAGDFILVYTAEDALVKVNWSSLPGAGGGISNVVEDATPELGGDLETNNFDIKFEQFSADAVDAEAIFQKSRNAAIGSHTIVEDGDDLGTLRFQGSNGTAFDDAAAIRAEVDGTPGASTDMPGRLVFSTTANASATLTDRLILDSAGVLKPNANDGVPLGTGALSFSDLFLASGAVINFNNGNLTITHSAGDLAITGTVTLANEGLHLLDTNASHDLIIKPGSDLTADRIFTITTGDAARTLSMGGNITTAADLITSGANSLTLTTTGVTDVTFPTSGTLATTTHGTGKQAVYIPANAMVARTTAGAASFTVELATNDVMIAGFDFDTATSEGVQFTWAIPKQWNESTVTCRAYWTAASGSGTVQWGIRARANSDDDAIDQAWGTQVDLTADTLLTANDVHVTAESGAVTIGGTPAEGDLCFFEVSRTVSGDTLGVDARLLGIELYITTNAVTDA